MPGGSMAFPLPPPEVSSSGNRRTVVECKNIKTTPGKHLKSDPSSLKTFTVGEKQQEIKTRVQPDTTELTALSSEKNYKFRSVGLSSACNQPSHQLVENDVAVPKQQQVSQVCSSCSSTEVIEVNIKLKSCQNCQNVVIDELNYDNQRVDENDTDANAGGDKCKSSNSSGNLASGLSFYHQQLMMITKKVKNMYKNRIHSSYTEDQQSKSVHNKDSMQPSRSTGSTPITTTVETVVSSVSSCADKTTSAERRPVRIITSQNPSIQIGNCIHNNHCCTNNLPTDDRECSTRKISSISNLPFKSNPSNNNNSNGINKDAVILRICDLDDKVKSMRNEDYTPMNSTASTSDTNAETSNSFSTKALRIGDTQNDNFINKKSSPKTMQTTTNRKIVIISDEYRKKLKKNDVYIKDRRERAKKFQQNKSKSLDLLPPSSQSNKTSLRKNCRNPVCSSQSVTNLSKQGSVDGKGETNKGSNADDVDDDDDGPYESINSVELIFISDEFLNKAVKHDLKILKNKQTTTESDTNQPALTKKKKVRKIESTASPTAATLRPENNAVDSLQKTPSPVSPDSHQSFKIGSHRTSITSNKKLIVISEDFKRKSLENNVVILDTCGAHDVNSIGEAIDKRKNFQQSRKLSRQQSSIDDVANHMVSHAFRSFEEPDEQCLESKEIKTPE